MLNYREFKSLLSETPKISMLDGDVVMISEAKSSGYDDEHAFVNVWNHAVHNPQHLASPSHLKREIDAAKNDPKHPLNFANQINGFTGGKKQPEHESAYYAELHHAAKAVHDIAKHPLFKDAVANKHHADVAGDKRGTVSDLWKSHGAGNATSKADITIGGNTVSLKKGDAQLMSAGKEETKATYDHAMRGMVVHGHATEKDHAEVMKHITKLQGHLAAMKTATDDDEMTKHRIAGQAIVDMVHKKHPKLSRYIHYEASTGHGKFGTHGTGHARFIVTTHPTKATHIHDTETEDIGHEDNLKIPRVSKPKGSGREGNVKLDHKA